MTGRRLLVIEDDENIAALVCRIASEMGFTAGSASGSSVEAAYQKLQPEIIVLDIVMPDMDGLEVLQFLRAQGSSARIILLSGSPESYRRIAQNMGIGGGLTIDANVSKPFRAADLRLVLEKSDRLLGAAVKPPAPVTARATATA